MNRVLKDWTKIRVLVLNTIFQDCAYYARNPKCKEDLKDWGNSQLYNAYYWDELLEDIDSDWFKGFCHYFSLNHGMVKEFLLTNKKYVHVNDEFDVLNLDLAEHRRIYRGQTQDRYDKFGHKSLIARDR